MIRNLEQIIEWRRKPKAIRCDNGPEYVSGALTTRAKDQDIQIDYMLQPGKPQQNDYVERYNRTVRNDWLNQPLFESIADAQDAATRAIAQAYVSGAVSSTWQLALVVN